MEYQVSMRFDLGKAVDGIGDLEKGINAHLSTMGIADMLVIRSGKVALLTLTCDRKLTAKEKTKLKPLIASSFEERLPWNWSVESIRRKSSKPRSQTQSR